MLNYRYQTFLQVAKDLSYTKAAQNLCLTQPSVSKHIRHIENELNVKLFEYENKQLCLTPEGKFLFNEILLLERQITKIKQKLVEPSPAFTLFIGASRTIGEYYLPNYTDLFTTDALNFDLTVGNTDFLARALKKAEIDCALISGPIDQFNGFSKHVFYEDRIVLASSPNHHLAGKTVSYKDILNENIVLREKGAGIYQALCTALDRHNFSCGDFTHALTFNNIGLIIKLLSYHEPRLSFFYLSSIQNELNEGSLAEVKISDLDLHQKYFLIYNDQLVYPSKIELLYKLISAAA